MTTPTNEDLLCCASNSLKICSAFQSDLEDTKVCEEFITAATEKIGRYSHYKYFSPSAKNIIQIATKKYGNEVVRVLLRMVLLKAIILLINCEEFKKLPAKIQKYQRMHLQRIANDSGVEEEWLDISKDLYQKEFGITTLRLYAAGAQLIDPYCGVPRSILTRNGLFGVPKLLIKFILLGGFKPYFQTHTHKFNLDQFHELGWEECYKCCAELYRIFPESLGMFGSSWFYDPALDNISPRLAYLRNTPLVGGAFLTYYSADDQAIANALSTSISRKKLFDEGKYVPKNFMLIWGKLDQIAWAASNADL